jgi:hypothetical protein
MVKGFPPRSADDGGGTPLGVEGAKPPAFFGCVTLKPDWYYLTVGSELASVPGGYLSDPRASRWRHETGRVCAGVRGRRMALR